MTEIEFKHLLLDLRLSISEVGRTVGISRWAVNKYFRGEMHKQERRRQIKGVLLQRAREKGVTLPAFWPDVK